MWIAERRSIVKRLTLTQTSSRVDAARRIDHHALMIASMSTEERVRQLHDRAVNDLIVAHRQRADEPLVLAIRFDVMDTEDIHILEILNGFPGGDDDELLVTEFEPSAQLRILGKLHLTLGSPAQLESAVRRGDAQVERFKNGRVVHDDGSPRATVLRAKLAL